MNINQIDGLSISEKNYLHIQMDSVLLKFNKIKKARNRKIIFSIVGLFVFSLIVGSFLYFVAKAPGTSISWKEIFDNSIMPFSIGVIGIPLILIFSSLDSVVIYKKDYDKIFIGLLKKELNGFTVKSGIDNRVKKLKQLNLIDDYDYLSGYGDDGLFGSNKKILNFSSELYTLSSVNLYGSPSLKEHIKSCYSTYIIELFDKQCDEIVNNLESKLVENGIDKYNIRIEDNKLYIVLKNDLMTPLFKQINKGEIVMFRHYIDNYIRIRKINSIFEDVFIK